MRNDDHGDALAAELRELGRQVTVEAHDEGLVTQVMARVAAEPAPRAPGRLAWWAERGQRTRDWFRGRKKAVAAALAALLIGLAATPPVRAAMAEWFGFGGVIVREDPAPAPSIAPPPPAAESGLSLTQAVDLVAFTPVLPSALGRPDGVEVSGDRRVLSLTWSDSSPGALRLDQFDGTLAPVMAKLAHDATLFDVAGTQYLWFAEPHEVVVLDLDGTERTESARLAGNTLIWERSGMTLRLEGDLSREHAVVIARSVRVVR